MKLTRNHTTRLATRREFLSWSARGTGLAALSSWAPSFITDTVMAAGASATNKDATIFVLIKLGGGNDGLNMLIPFDDDTYYEYRPKTAVKKEDALKIHEHFGLNPVCTGFQEMFKEGHLAMFHDVGYPNSSHSHFSGQDFYERAGGLEFVGTGWLGRFLDAECPADRAKITSDPIATHISRHLPMSLNSTNPQPVFSMLSSNVKQLMQRSVKADATAQLLRKTIAAGEMETNDKVRYLNMAYMNALITEDKVRDIIANYQPDGEYPETTLANDMRAVASMIAAEMGNRVYSLEIGGFDTHANQVQRHGDLLGELSGAISAFFKDLGGKRLADKVIVMPFSEFGRRPYENGTEGTDHGSNSAFLVAGTKVKGGIYGKHPEIPKDGRSDIPFVKSSIDFRQIYATILDRWLGTKSEAILRDKYKHIEFLA